MLDKKSLSERDICTKFITPAIVKAGWDSTTQFLEEVSFTDGKIYVPETTLFEMNFKLKAFCLKRKYERNISCLKKEDFRHCLK